MRFTNGDGHSDTVLCQHQGCGRLPINDKRHYAWAFRSLKEGEEKVKLNIVGAHLASGDTDDDHEKRRVDMEALKKTLKAIPGNEPTFVVMDANYGLRSKDYAVRTGELKAMQLLDGLGEDKKDDINGW